tara:strand:+ start:4535 stop:5806 length:1272 start_codon:yes stop_codon:yes gene_type:complete
MIKDLTLQEEKNLANELFYEGGVTKKYEGGGGFEWKDDTQANIAGTGLSAASAAVSALDNDPGYGTADVAGSALQFASMGAAAGPIGAAIGGAIGLGVGLIKKKQFKKQEAAAKKRAEQEEGYALAMADNADLAEGFSKGGTIYKYVDGGETKPTNTLQAYMDSKRKEMSPEELKQIENTGTITQDKGMWNEDKSMAWNARNLLNEAVNSVQTASLRPGGSGGRKNVVTTAASEMFALPSINRLIKPGGNIEHIAHDPSDPSGYAHAAMNIIGAAPGASLLRGTISKNIPALKGVATKLTSETQKLLSNKIGETGVVAAETVIPYLHRTEKILHQGHRADEITKAASGKSYAVGGMTPGAYNHTTNPLAVVDKNGNHTGMELTGGEGVFDKPAMENIKKLLSGGRFDEVGKFVNREMKTWKHK